MSQSSKFNGAFNAFKQKYKNDIGEIGKILGTGSSGEIRSVIYKDKPMAVKIMEKAKKEKIEGEKLALNLGNQNIIKIHKIYEGVKFKNASRDICNLKSRDRKNKRINSRKKVNKDNSDLENNYHFIIMEKATIGDLGKINKCYHRHNLLKLINYSNDNSLDL